MNNERKERCERVIIQVFLALLVGGVSALVTRNSSNFYQTITKPPLAPPGIAFPIVWTILFILMGVSVGLISNSVFEEKKCAFIFYGIQLGLNFFWSIIFFRFRLFLFAFLWLILLWVTIILMIREFYKINKVAAYLQIPYLLWVTFAGYLNLAIYLLN